MTKALISSKQGIEVRNASLDEEDCQGRRMRVKAAHHALRVADFLDLLLKVAGGHALRSGLRHVHDHVLLFGSLEGALQHEDTGGGRFCCPDERLPKEKEGEEEEEEGEEGEGEEEDNKCDEKAWELR